MIAPQRKKQIINLAEFAAHEFSHGNTTLLHEIAKFEGVQYYFDNYEDAFDGILLYDHREFHIHLNIDKGNSEESKRGRFTFAHELGHYLLDEHRLGLKYGLLEPHASFHNYNQTSKIEIEANFFASNLLMPADKFRKQSGGKKFSFETILNLSESFQTSIQAVLIRFEQIGTHEIFAIVSNNGVVKWSVKSEDFPRWKHRYKNGDTIPETILPNSTRKNMNVSLINTSDPEKWFIIEYEDNRANRIMYEQWFYSKNYMINMMWFD